ncbi:MAG: hypothetical protein GX629_00920 [Phycisphaerae bacterium]|jgi:hypothetical protein|nr:hypothetical protein [Phycisphaerae bacterium]
MAGIIIVGVIALACVSLGYFMYRSMKASGGCGCCSGTKEHRHSDHSDCCCENHK